MIHRIRARAFTLIELLVVICIIGILSVLSYAPYSYYANIARVRSSSERVAQLISEARLSVANGYPFGSGSENADIFITLEQGSGSVTSYAALAAKPTDTIHIRSVDLESGVSIAALASGYKTVVLHYKAPDGRLEILDTSTKSVIPPESFTGGIVGMGGAKEWALSKSFTISQY